MKILKQPGNPTGGIFRLLLSDVSCKADKKFCGRCNKTGAPCINRMKGVRRVLMWLLPVQAAYSQEENDRLDACLAKMAQGDTAALAQLYDCTSTAVYSFALSVLKNAQDAQDVLHDCYVAVYSAAADYRSRQKPMAWILTIARNLCLQKLRGRQRETQLPPEDWETHLAVCEAATGEDRMVIRECMGRLSDEERQIVVLHAVAGFKHREIAQTLGLPLPTVLSKYRRAIHKLQKFLGEERAE